MFAKDHDVELTEKLLECSVPPADEADAALVEGLRTVRTVIHAFESVGVIAPSGAVPPPCPTWGPFVLREQIGQGRFGIVYRASDPVVGRELAIKLYEGSELPDEPRLMARVSHPNVVTVFGAAVHDGKPGTWMELLRGRTLAERVQADGPLPPREVAGIGIDVCKALEAVHAAGLVHQDIKAQNVMLEADGRVVLTDFGSVQQIERETGESFSGTPLYMAPEVLLGGAPSAPSDVYSLGVLLYYLLTGTYPVYAPDAEELRRLHERRGNRSQRSLVTLLRELRPETSRLLANCVAGCLATTDKRYRSIAELKGALLGLESEPSSTGFLRRLVVLGSAILLLGGGAIVGHRFRSQSDPEKVVLRRMTWDQGLSTDPVASRDGKFLAFASDRSGEDSLDIWVQQMSGGGEPLRITTDASDDSQPSFSPDGSTIVFRSERDGGGLYVIPTLGGEARLIARNGRSPRFSPDGRWISYVSTDWSFLFVMPSTGGEPRQFPISATAGATPGVWSPDSRYILLLGSPNAPLQDQWDWWLVAVGEEATVPRRTHARQALLPHFPGAIENPPRPWDWRGTRVIFSATEGDTTNLWEVSLRGGRLDGPPRRLTISSGAELQPRFIDDKTIAFSTQESASHLAELRLSGRGGASGGPVRLVTRYFSHIGNSAISNDGRWIAFPSKRLGSSELWLHDLETGKEHQITAPPWPKAFPVFSADGEDLLYRSSEPDGDSIHSVPRNGGIAQKVCSGCGFPTSVSPDNRYVLFQHAWTGQATIWALDRRTSKRARILGDEHYPAYRARLSNDGHWVIFHASHRSGAVREHVAPFRGLTAIEPQEWADLTDGTARTDAPRWSTDDRHVYYVSDRDGFQCIWGQALDDATKRPIGDAFAVQHFHRRQRSLSNLDIRVNDLAVARTRLVFGIGEISGNIWVAEFR
jgi:serine/threonine protein kinase